MRLINEKIDVIERSLDNAVNHPAIDVLNKHQVYDDLKWLLRALEYVLKVYI